MQTKGKQKETALKMLCFQGGFFIAPPSPQSGHSAN
jgi:hypothetical protein